MLRSEITCHMAAQALTENGYSVSAIQPINEGSNHFVFDVTLTPNQSAICKFIKIRDTEKGLGTAHQDTLFGGSLSLKRESYLLQMAALADVPVPQVYGTHDSTVGSFILLQKMTGFSHKECMKQSGYSKSLFLNSLYYLGQDFAKIQKIKFSSFGNIMDKGQIEPAGITNFSQRFASVIEMRLTRCHIKKVFRNSAEEKRVGEFFQQKLKDHADDFSLTAAPPVLVFTDMHAENFFTNTAGKPTGYFDLESSQAAPAALEYYGFLFFLFNFYDRECFDLARQSFWSGYTSDGTAIPKDCQNQALVDFLAACRILELAQSYWGYIDGIRDDWGEKMRALLFHYMDTACLDYLAIGDIWRSRDHQPFSPLKP